MASGRSQPWTIVLTCAGAMLISYFDRVSISVTGLAMQRDFGWSEATKGMILSAFFAGYLVVQIFGGWLAHRFGGRRVLIGALGFWSVCMMLTPLAADAGIAPLIAMRIALGFGEGPLNPAAFAIMGRHVAPTGRAQATSIYASASFLGTTLALIVVAWLTTHYGWRSVFYVCGAVGLLYAAWARAAFPRDEQGHEPVALAARRVPWRRLFAIGPFWALAYAFTCTNWVLYVLLLWMPSYFAAMFHLSLIGTGAFALVPWLVMFGAVNVAGWLADRACRRDWNVTFVRKAWAATGLTCAAVALVSVRWAMTPEAALIAFCGALAGIAVSYASHSPNTYDLAPDHAHVLYAIMNTFGSLPGVIGVGLTGILVSMTGSYDDALAIAAALAGSGAIVFLVWGTGRQRYPVPA